MVFKTGPAQVSRPGILTQLVARLTGRPIPLRPGDPEVCTPSEREVIVRGFEKADTYRARIAELGGECVTLAACLASKGSLDTTIRQPQQVYVTCANCAPSTEGNSSSSAAASSMQLCLAGAQPFLTQSYIDGVVFRELIRLCGGTELDAWGRWHYFYMASGGSWYGLPIFVGDAMCAGSVPGTAPTPSGFRGGPSSCGDRCSERSTRSGCCPAGGGMASQGHSPGLTGTRVGSTSAPRRGRAGNFEPSDRERYQLDGTVPG